ncbi:uncharacterized protein ntf4 [Misgurnus anguillicaudatus]|uniref:uncharacterized protein ntf4 n=1 Tax=Misgurnus anguillicaudatus TaxID=75329 RepID=UPI003CCF58E2
MHWLPLVAMVIASALPFPQSPVSRLVAATIEPGRNDSNSSYSVSMPVNSTASNISHDAHSNNSLSKYDRTADTYNHTKGKDITLSPFTYEADSISEANQANILSDDTKKRDFTGGGRTTGESRDYMEYKSHKKHLAKNASSSNNVLKDYQPEFHEEKSTGGDKDDMNMRSSLDVSKGSPKGSQEHQDETQSGGSSNQGEMVKPAGVEVEVPMKILKEGLGAELGFGLDAGLRGEDQMLLDAHPRVLFSPALSPPKHPPLLLMLELGLLADDVEDEESHTMDATPAREGADQESYKNLLLGVSDSSHASSHEQQPSIRRKRQLSHNTQSRQRSVCEAESGWVTDKKTSVDQKGQTVNILPEIQTQTGPLKQYFYETKCRKPSQQGKGEGQGVEGAGCLGVDKKHWMSKCETKQSFVRALTSDVNNRVGWRWIRIDSSCVCVLLTRGTYYTEKKAERVREGRGYR